MANKEYNFQYTPLTGRLPGISFVKQTEQAINELAGIVNEGAAQVKVITNLANQANDNSEAALEKATEALETSGRVYITLPNLDDADDYFDSQLYYFANSYSHNLPVADTGFLEVKTNDTKTACEQEFVADLTGLSYFRHGTITSTEVGSETVYSVTWGTWSGELASEDYVQQEIVTAINAANGYTDEKVADCLPLSGGTMTGAITLSDGGNPLSTAGGTMTGTVVHSNSTAIKKDTDDGDLVIEGASAYNKGAYLQLYGKDHSSSASCFSIVAHNGTNSPSLVGFPNGTLIWNGNNIITSALTGNVLSAYGTSTAVNTNGDLCSISTHDAGVWLIIGFVDLNYSGSASFYINKIDTANHGARDVRATPVAGGGSVNIVLESLSENELVSLKGYQTQAGTMRGALQMVQLA